jgi:hypothetical protein
MILDCEKRRTNANRSTHKLLKTMGLIFVRISLNTSEHLCTLVCNWRSGALSELTRISVLVPQDEAERFEAYCRERGFKKSTLIARLIREHLDSERFAFQPNLLPTRPRKAAQK